ncbi:MAG: hypothetical protein ACI8UO_003513 [Verrucomicrobiales bacterium]
MHLSLSECARELLPGLPPDATRKAAKAKSQKDIDHWAVYDSLAKASAVKAPRKPMGSDDPTLNTLTGIGCLAGLIALIVSICVTGWTGEGVLIALGKGIGMFFLTAIPFIMILVIIEVLIIGTGVLIRSFGRLFRRRRRL